MSATTSNIHRFVPPLVCFRCFVNWVFSFFSVGFRSSTGSEMYLASYHSQLWWAQECTFNAGRHVSNTILLFFFNGTRRVECFYSFLQLMSKMAPLLGRDVTERVFLKRFSQLCASNMFYTRKVCASHIGDFCAVVGKEQFEKVLVSTL